MPESGVWVKSGPNASGDGPGDGERFDFEGELEEVIHGAPASGPNPHITVTFYSDETGGGSGDTATWGTPQLVN